MTGVWNYGVVTLLRARFWK